MLLSPWTGRIRQGLNPEHLRTGLFWLVWLTMLLFPFTRVARVVGPLLCLVPLLALYLLDWKHSRLRALPVRWLLALPFLCMGAQIVFSLWPGLSWQTVSPNLRRAGILLFAALECVRSERDLRRLIYAFAAATVVEGLDGIWQFATGHDLLLNLPAMSGRLTGSFNTYRVGDYMGIALTAAFGLGLFLPARLQGGPRWRRWATVCLILAPGLFLWMFARARIGNLALATALCVLCACYYGRRGWLALLIPVVTLVCLLWLSPFPRYSLAGLLNDPRTELWETGWQTFLHAPWLGTGAGTYVPALQQAGLKLIRNPYGVQHPHNIYLQWLIDGGLIGFAAYAAAFFGLLIWSGQRIWHEARREWLERSPSTFWRAATFFWGGYLAYLIVGLAGHSFYRDWFMAMGFTMLGLTLGVCAAPRAADR